MQSLDGALCAQADPDLWFPGEGGNGEAAKRICRACPVRAACLADTLDRPHSTRGIVAGYGPRDIAAMRRARRACKAAA